MNEFSLSGKERRADERKPLRSQAHLLPLGQAPFAVRLIDISEGGLRVACSVNPPLMTVSLLRMSVPTADRAAPATVEVKVQVINSIYARAEDGFRVGMQFLELSSAHRDVISAYLAT